MKTSERVSVFRFPPISIKCPSSWIDEAARYDNWSLQEGAEYLRGWNSAKRISKRAFAAYFNLQREFTKNHTEWAKKCKLQTDFTLSYKGQTTNVVIQTIPVKDYKPKIGRAYSSNVWKSNRSQNQPLIHVFTIWWCPIVFLLGWIDNKDLTGGKQQIKDHHLKPIYNHPILEGLDKRAMYV
jgi:hypothetical protein